MLRINCHWTCAVDGNEGSISDSVLHFLMLPCVPAARGSVCDGCRYSTGSLRFKLPTSSNLTPVHRAGGLTLDDKFTKDYMFGVHAGSSLTESLSLITTWGYLCWNHSVTEALMAGTQEYARFSTRWVKETIEGPCRLFNGPTFKDIIEAFVRALDSEASRSQKILPGSVSLGSPVDNHWFNIRTFFFFKTIHRSCTFNVLSSCSCSGCS